ncbi:hypothetical protein EKO04_010086 [Ascochyta lentis]|uniref:C2H2-domain containing protein second zinc finger domain-containing protein n=1 Tax=Ascochyta lentis TaxID=205686 RepID=A0A8H7IYN1_9PLEO|nr:hypothetical protein EKO04_010086 [Ascochyta lentis]
MSKRRNTRRPPQPAPHMLTPRTNDSQDTKPVIIGLLLSDGNTRNDRYQCPFSTCTELTFGRPAELKRHHASCHKGYGSKKPQYWCPVSGCDRSKVGHKGSFPRKDKMMDHLERAHRDEVGGG